MLEHLRLHSTAHAEAGERHAYRQKTTLSLTRHLPPCRHSTPAQYGCGVDEPAAAAVATWRPVDAVVAGADGATVVGSVGIVLGRVGRGGRGGGAGGSVAGCRFEQHSANTNPALYCTVVYCTVLYVQHCADS